MEVRPGYKQTEVGVIPDEWDASRLQRASANITVGFVGSMAHLFVRDGVPLLRGQNILPQALDLSELKFVSLATHQLWKKSALLPGDVAIVRVGYPGTACVIPVGLGELNAASLVLVRPDKACIDSDYLACVLNSSWGKRQIGSLLVGGAQQVFNTRTAAAFVVPLPALPEQRAIAAALSDVDALLGGLDRLIAKKRDLKQAAMQQLLTGQTRLPGFSGAWEVKRLGDHVTFLRNGVNSRAELRAEGRVKYLHYGDIHASANSFLSPQTLPSLPDAKAARLDRLHDGDVIFADASEDIAGVCKSVELSGASDTEVVAGLHTIAARFDKAILADGFKGFLQYCPSFAAHLRRLAAGTKVYATNRAHIRSVEMRLPSVPEQTAIAAVLADMDAELAALEARRDKTRDLKQAMMQVLLTGKTRLVTPETAHA